MLSDLSRHEHQLQQLITSLQVEDTVVKIPFYHIVGLDTSSNLPPESTNPEAFTVVLANTDNLIYAL